LIPSDACSAFRIRPVQTAGVRCGSAPAEPTWRNAGRAARRGDQREHDVAGVRVRELGRMGGSRRSPVVSLIEQGALDLSTTAARRRPNRLTGVGRRDDAAAQRRRGLRDNGDRHLEHRSWGAWPVARLLQTRFAP
jgi:hypothetical protein